MTHADNMDFRAGLNIATKVLAYAFNEASRFYRDAVGLQRLPSTEGQRHLSLRSHSPLDRRLSPAQPHRDLVDVDIRQIWISQKSPAESQPGSLR